MMALPYDKEIYENKTFWHFTKCSGCSERTWNHIEVFTFTGTPVSINGQLTVCGTKLCNKNGVPFHLQQKPFILTVVGMEKALTEGLSINLQYLNRWVQNYTNPFAITDPNIALVATQSAITSQQMGKMNHGTSLRLDHKFLNDTLEMEIAWIKWFTTDEQVLRPRIGYSLSDKVKLIAWWQFYSGSNTSFFGRIKDISAGFVEYRLSY
ncbi:MAG: hypothetical protein ABIQ95_12325 [Bdellovibrionia bacterium]